MKKLILLKFTFVLFLFSCEKDPVSPQDMVKDYTFTFTTNNADLLKTAKLKLTKGQQVIEKNFTISGTKATAVVGQLLEKGEWRVEVHALGKVIQIDQGGGQLFNNTITSSWAKSMVMSTPTIIDIPVLSANTSSEWLIEYYEKVLLADGAYIEILRPYTGAVYVKIKGSTNLTSFYSYTDRAAFGTKGEALCDGEIVAIIPNSGAIPSDRYLRIDFPTIGGFINVFNQNTWHVVDNYVVMDTNKGLCRSYFYWSK